MKINFATILIFFLSAVVAGSCKNETGEGSEGALQLFQIGLAMDCASPGTTPEIDGENAVSELKFIEIDGVQHNILIRGKDSRNPVLLWIHGGPGSPETGYARMYMDLLEERFTVAVYEQRGAGRSYNSSIDPETMTTDQLVKDGVQVAKYLIGEFTKEKIYIIGHSWGGFLGAKIVQSDHSLFYSYISMDGAIDMERTEALSYQYVFDQASGEGNGQALEELDQIGTPPYQDSTEALVQRKWLDYYHGAFHDSDYYDAMIAFLMNATEYNTCDLINISQGTGFSLEHLWDTVMGIDLMSDPPRFEIPVHIFQGKYDQVIPEAVSREYYESITAPSKSYTIFENSGHSPNLEESEAFQKKVIEVFLGDS